ncbi:hypothetical protein J5U23_01682 [Saccharolobus shibatae B12]|uniref:Uncharacterized protein n=1 Tax=Saccharolobus shibatae (strain ATCC 51178 / DSM 5389 / JCM 8931 / NBRC 15437 / B12) TaxID=523848 RepID=A0A8F5GTC9_SACSH|nr:hypothetical protein J5U23_01682 [Saccharolobus shibatae B12]
MKVPDIAIEIAEVKDGIILEGIERHHPYTHYIVTPRPE